MFCLKFPYLANISAYILVFKIFSNRLMIYDYSSHERFTIETSFFFNLTGGYTNFDQLIHM